MPWLLRDDRVLASLELTVTRAERRRGLLGRDGFDGAMLFEPARSVHTLGMRFAIDVAFCDRDRVVIDTITMPPGRLSRPRLRARSIVEAEAGNFERWGLAVGDHLAISETR